MLGLLLLLPLAAALYVRARRRPRAVSPRGAQLLQNLAQPIGARRHVPPALFAAGLALLIVGLARPQAVVSVPRIAGTVMLAFDVSGSMAAEDAEPSRMEAAKSIARAFVEQQPPGVRIGVTAFSDGGLTVQAPTDNRDELLAAIERVSPQRGTSLGQGILAALSTIAAASGEAPPVLGPEDATPAEASGTWVPATIVLFSDGENTAPPDPFEVAALAAERGVRIHTVGVGSTNGFTLQLEDFSVHTRLDAASLQQIAELTAGSYYDAERQGELGLVYQELARRLVVEPESIEITALLAGAGILLLLAGGVCSLIWFGRMP
jgi:Ca-activated chloride channel family protein